MNIPDQFPAVAQVIVALIGIVIFGDGVYIGTDKPRRMAAVVWVLCMVYVVINRVGFLLGYPPIEIVADIGRVLTPIGWGALAVMETRRQR